MVIEMKEFGRSLVSRASGRLAYVGIAQSVASSKEAVVFDFSGVEIVTNSFADEVFGRLAYEMGMDELKRRTTFRNVPPFWARIIRNAMEARASQRVEPVTC